MDKYDELEKLKRLLDDGAITAEEFEQEKAKLLSENGASSKALWGMEENVYCMLLHLSQLLGFVIPFGGIVAPIVMWVSYKDLNPTVDAHGRNVMNWVLSEVIYLIISFILVFLIVGFFLIWALVIIGVVFAVIGSIKASNGEVWEYPMSIKFFRQSSSDPEQAE